MLLLGQKSTLTLPAFFPDATHGVIKGLSSSDLISTKTPGIVVNAYHLYLNNSAEVIKRCGGIHKFINYHGVIISDSGGFQAMSLVRKNRNNGSIKQDGIHFKIQNGPRVIFTPQVSIETQLKIGGDIVMCLDDCTEPFESQSQQVLSVKRTIEWAKECKRVFTAATASYPQKPLLFGIIQGGESFELRKECANALVEIGFDGYAFGGWPVGQNNTLLEDVLAFTADLMPFNKPKYAMGVGKPADILKCIKMGYNMFDCVLPTRDARHKRMYVNTENGNFGYLYIGSGKYALDQSPIETGCDCTTCKEYTRAYTHHLFKRNESTAVTLATIHNLRFYSKLMEETSL